MLRSLYCDSKMGDFNKLDYFELGIMQKDESSLDSREKLKDFRALVATP